MRGHEQQTWAFAETDDAEIAALRGVGGGERNGASLFGVKALMRAILEDAIRAYLGPIPSSHREAAFWIADSRSRWVFSFPVVCETLGLEPEAVRAAVHRAHARSPVWQPLGFVRCRQNARRQAGSIGTPPDRTDRPAW